MREWKRERYVMPKTHEQVCKKKRLFMRLLRFNLDVEQKRMYESAVNHCDRITVRITEKAKRCAGLLIVLLALLFSSGCLENTMRGMGKMIQGTGELIGGVGKDVVRGTDGYSNER